MSVLDLYVMHLLLLNACSFKLKITLGAGLKKAGDFASYFISVKFRGMCPKAVVVLRCVDQDAA